MVLADDRAALRAACEPGVGLCTIVGIEGSLAFVTVHPEGIPTPLYWLDADRITLQQDELPCGGVALAADGNTVYVGGTDKRVYVVGGRGGAKPLAGPFAGAAPGDVRTGAMGSGHCGSRGCVSRELALRCGSDRAVL